MSDTPHFEEPLILTAVSPDGVPMSCTLEFFEETLKPHGYTLVED